MAVGAAKYTAEFTSSPHEGGTAQDYTIEIFDADYASTTETFKVDGSGFNIRFDADGNEHYAPINGSRCDFNFYVQNSDQETFINTVMGAEEGRYTVKIKRGANIHWIGVLIVDGITREDMSYPYKVKITAADGLARLKDVDYNNAGTAYSGKETILGNILNCLNKIPTEGFYTTGIFLYSNVNWYETRMTYNTANEPTELTRVDHGVWYDTDEEGNVTYKSCYDVLQNCLTIFGAQIKYSDGNWKIQQVTEEDKASFNIRWYQKDGTKISSQATTN